MARLVILSEGMAGKVHELAVEKTTIGRVDGNTFPIPEGSISSHHCEILLRGSEIIVHDLQSTNGTFVNGNQVTGEAVLKPGTILRLGQVELRVEDNAAARPAVPVKNGNAGPAKKMPDETMVITQGVQLGKEPSTTINLTSGVFTKKKNTGTKIFIAVISVIAVGVIILLLFMFVK